MPEGLTIRGSSPEELGTRDPGPAREIRAGDEGSEYSKRLTCRYLDSSQCRIETYPCSHGRETGSGGSRSKDKT